LAQRIAGIAHLTVAGDQIMLRGNLNVSPSSVERTMLVGQDAVHGYQELPRVPFIECDMSTMPGVYIEDLLLQTDVTIVAELANGMVYTLTQANCKGGFEINSRDGQVRIRWEGITCQEVSAGAGPSLPFGAGS
jgi:hypothetical protein